MTSQTVLHRGRSLKIVMQSSLLRHFKNRPMPLTSSVVDQISTRFSNFFSPIKVNFPGEKEKIFETEAEIYFSPKNILRLGAL